MQTQTSKLEKTLPDFPIDAFQALLDEINSANAAFAFYLRGHGVETSQDVFDLTIHVELLDQARAVERDKQMEGAAALAAICKPRADS